MLYKLNIYPLSRPSMSAQPLLRNELFMKYKHECLYAVMVFTNEN